MTMTPTYADIEMLTEETRWQDRAPQMPLVGFVIGTGLSLLFWGALAWGAWILVA